MADIKTRDSIKGTIKTFDKSAVAADHMRSAYIQTKEKAEHSTNAKEDNAEEYASDRIEDGMSKITHEAVNQFDRQGRKSVEVTKQNIFKAQSKIQHFKEKRAAESLKRQAAGNKPIDMPSTHIVTNKEIRAAEQTQKTIKQTARSSGKKSIKTMKKGVTKATQKGVKTAERTAKTNIKTTKEAAKNAQKTAKAAQKSAQAAKKTAKAIAKGIKVTVKAAIAAVRAIIAAAKTLITAIAAGGWVAVVVIIIICLIAAIIGSVYGIFLSGENVGTGMTMQTAVQEINMEYDNKLKAEKSAVTYDILEMRGSRAVWKDVLAVYAIKVNTDKDNPQEVATMNDSKKQLLKKIFWEMNQISSRTEKKTETQIIETDDGHGNIVQTKKTVTRTYLYITVSHKTASEMAAQYNFNPEQKNYLVDLLKDENNSMWSAVLYGISSVEGEIVSVALSQIGNVGGAPYWSWYGFNSRVEWCACFVSWCANECGYIEAGVIPKFASCTNGVAWFKDRGQWLDGSAEPTPGMIIFFDWENDRQPEHVGIVEKVENGTVYTIEGNSGDSCQENRYAVGHSSILGYGVPQY